MNEIPTSQDTKLAIIRGIRSVLLELGSATKVELSGALQISFPTAGKFLLQMEKAGEVFLVGLDESSGGRRAQRYAYNPNYRLGLAIFLERNETNYTIFNALGERIDDGNTASLLGEEISSLTKLIETIKHAYPAIHAVSIGVPGAVNNGKIFLIPAYEHYRDVDLKHYLEERLSIPVVVENDMNAAVLGYQDHHKLQDKASLAYIYLGQNGPGAGIVVNGEIVRGKSYFSGEVSFIPQYDNQNFHQALTIGKSGGATASAMEDRIDAISRIVVSITAILNPHTIIFGKEEVNSSMLYQITERSAVYVPKEHLPELAASDWKQDYLYGLQRLGLSLLLSYHTHT
ncbi:ROK family protein [Paenibacillus sp. 1011MAR3C5]|uniref:ROK family protein n=1 Tax=Paenibacillus sp. 1011MAR3C5 TaxID=1675787 RepID=UPI000E6C3F64|nr:ROK family protein [Paenibacillus sp. 1011MAR3C5]RJE83920.1 ROK family protein [Paenibacillus sp. 1011MAR3C5]